MILNIIIGFLAGFVGALGLGGGGVLVMFLTAFLGVDQLKSQGINLLFFIPIGILALIIHSKKKLIDWKTAIPAIIFGLIGAGIGCFLAQFLGNFVMRLIFGVILALLGIFELFFPHKNKQNNDKNNTKEKKGDT